MKSSETDAEAAIRDLLSRRERGSTICPSEAARALAGEQDFRPLMDVVRGAARSLAERGELEVTQGGEVVEPGSARGPIRLRLAPDGTDSRR